MIGITKIDAKVGTLTSSGFEARNIKSRIDFWTSLTRDTWVYQAITDLKLQFDNNPDYQRKREIQFSAHVETIVQRELHKLLAQHVIEKTQPSADQYVSNIFLRPKKDGSHRLILNLERLNRHVHNNILKWKL